MVMVDNLTLVYNIIKEHPYMLNMGKGLLAKRLKTTPEIVIKAKALIRRNQTPKEERKIPRILILDIETVPMKAYVWKRWKENISLDQTISEWFILCWSAKWLNNEYTYYDNLTPEEIKEENDYRILSSLYNLLDEADIVIAHNGSHFDIPKINSRLIVNGFNPPSPYKQIDTLDVAKKQFGFSSNKLDALATYFGIENKNETNFNLWKKCLEGDKEAIDYMVKYNINDVEILEKVYLRLRPWIKNHPNMSIYNDNKLVCSCCGSAKLEPIKDSTYDTNISKFPIFRCKNCGAISRSRVSVNTKPSIVSI